MHQTNIPWFMGLCAYRWNRIPENVDWFDRSQATWALNYAHRGQVSLARDGNDAVILNAPVAFVTWPGPRWTYGPVGSSAWEHVFISWLGERPTRWAAQGLIPDTCMKQSWIRVTDPDGFSRRFDHLHQLLDAKHPDDPAVVHASEGLFLHLHQQPAALEVNSLGEAVRQRIDDMRDEPGEAYDFNWEAQRMGCTPVHLRRLWKQQTGLPPGAWLQKIRMNRAASLLRSTEHDLERIAALVGYANMSLFSRLFRKAKALPPGQYRRSFRRIE